VEMETLGETVAQIYVEELFKKLAYGPRKVGVETVKRQWERLAQM